MMKNLTLKTKLHNGSEWLRKHLKDKINSSIYCHTYRDKKIEVESISFSICCHTH